MVPSTIANRRVEGLAGIVRFMPPPPNDSKKFGVRLRALRQSHKMSISDLSHASRVTAAYLSQLETGKRPTPGLGILWKIATGLRVSLDELTGFDVEALPPEQQPAQADAGLAKRLDHLEQTVKTALEMAAEDRRLIASALERVDRATKRKPATGSGSASRRKKAK